MKAWLTKAGRYKIEKIPCPHPTTNVQLSKPPTGVVHTTEGGWDSAMSVFRKHFAPHFLVGAGRIAQLVPLGKMAAALENDPGGVETNSLARVQIEVVAFSKETPWLPLPPVTQALAALLGTLESEAGIPLTRPFPDKMPPKPWATESFARRRAGKWGKTAGWYGHVEVPENAHWDPGALRWSELLELAKPKAPKYHIKLRAEGGREYEFKGIEKPGEKLADFGLVGHEIVQGWIERQ